MLSNTASSSLFLTISAGLYRVDAFWRHYAISTSLLLSGKPITPYYIMQSSLLETSEQNATSIQPRMQITVKYDQSYSDSTVY